MYIQLSFFYSMKYHVDFNSIWRMVFIVIIIRHHIDATHFQNINNELKSVDAIKLGPQVSPTR